MAKQNKSAINLSNESERHEPRWIGGRTSMPKAEKAYNPDLDDKLLKRAKENGKNDGFIAGALVVGIAWASHALTNWVMEKFSKA